MRYLLLLLLIIFSCPSWAAESNMQAAETKENVVTPKKEAAPEKTNEYSCKYYSVNLPDDWKVFLPPTDQQGLVRALFSKESQNPTVAMMIMPYGDTDLKTIADTFAEQLKAPKPPVEKNGQYIFTMVNNDLPTQVWVSSQGPLVMMTSITVNIKEGLNFLKNNVTTQDYRALFPK